MIFKINFKFSTCIFFKVDVDLFNSTPVQRLFFQRNGQLFLRTFFGIASASNKAFMICSSEYHCMKTSLYILFRLPRRKGYHDSFFLAYIVTSCLPCT